VAIKLRTPAKQKTPFDAERAFPTLTGYLPSTSRDILTKAFQGVSYRQTGLSDKEAYQKAIADRQKRLLMYQGMVPALQIPWPEYKPGEMPGQSREAVNPISPMDIFKVGMAEREAEMAAMEAIKQARLKGQGILARESEALGEGSRARQVSEETLGRLKGVPAEAQERQRGELEKSRDVIQELSPQAVEYRKQALREQQEREERTREEFRNLTAQQVQLQRQAIDEQEKAAIDSLRDAGLVPGTPQYAEAVRRIKMGSIEQRGNIAMQAGLAYNQAKAQMGQAYDAMRSAMRLDYDAYVTGTRQAQAQLALQADSLGKAIDDARMAHELALQASFTQTQLAADNLRSMGRQAEADYLLNTFEWVPHISDLLGGLQMFFKQEIDRTNRRIMQATYPAVRVVPSPLTAGRGTGSSGGGGNRQGGGGRNPLGEAIDKFYQRQKSRAPSPVKSSSKTGSSKEKYTRVYPDTLRRMGVNPPGPGQSVLY